MGGGVEGVAGRKEREQYSLPCGVIYLPFEQINDFFYKTAKIELVAIILLPLDLRCLLSAFRPNLVSGLRACARNLEVVGMAAGTAVGVNLATKGLGLYSSGH